MTPDLHELNELREHFMRFAALDGRDDALYVAMAQAIAQDDTLLALLLEAPAAQRRPVLLLACLHERVLAGSTHALAAYYASVGGTRSPDAQLPSHLHDFAQQERPALRHLLRTRSTQTNEIGRSSVLWAALQHTRLVTGRSELALLDFGCSAGLNLGVDQYRYRGHTLNYGAADDSAARPELAIHWRGGEPSLLAEPATWTLQARIGTDLEPLTPTNATHTRWLHACLWPGDAARRTRLALALQLASAREERLIASPDGLGALAQAQQAIDPSWQPVLFNSWVLAYMNDAQWQHHCERSRALVREQGWAWISAEPLARSPLHAALPEGESVGSATLWAMHWRDATGRVQGQALAWSHPHGRWAQWLASPIGSHAESSRWSRWPSDLPPC